MIIKDWFKQQVNRNLIFRIAVKEVEAWLLADIDGFSNYLGISKSLIGLNPEKIPNPKETLIQLAKRSRKRLIREDIIPRDEFVKVGPNYNDRLGDFVINHWNIERAMIYSDSLKRTFYHLKMFSMILPG